MRGENERRALEPKHDVKERLVGYYNKNRQVEGRVQDFQTIELKIVGSILMTLPHFEKIPVP